MLDISKWLHNALAPLGLKACEDPIREAVEGAYITWLPGPVRTVYASGAAVSRTYTVTVMLWVPAGDPWAELRDSLCAALVAAKARSVRPGDVDYASAIDRRVCSVAVTIWEAVP